MSEKSLKEVGKEASKHYSAHELRSGMLKNAERARREADGEYWQRHNNETSQEARQQSMQHWLDIEKREYNKQLAESAEFANDNAEQLHDLAVLEAHIGGVAIDVEQPVVAGQKIEVHKG